MVELATRTERHGGITLVEAAVTNDGTTPRRVRVASELDGPVWPPRRRGVPADGWEQESVIVHLAPGECVGLGFASPAAPVEPPVSVVESVRAAPDGGIRPSPAGVVRALGDPAPPRDVSVPGPATNAKTRAPSGAAPGPVARSDASDGTGAGGDPGSGHRPASEDDGTAPDDETPCVSVASRAPAAAPGPPAVAAWLAAVERRVGSGHVDADRLRAVADCARDLAARADRGDRR